MARTPDQPVSTDRGRQRRNQLLAATREAFEDVGYSRTTVADIVRRSGGSRASFYSYFTSADAALEELVRGLADELFEASTRPLSPGTSPFETLVSTIGQFMHAYRDRAPLLAVLDQATVASDAFRTVRLEIRMRFAEAIAQALPGRSRRQDPDGLEAHMMAIALGGMVEDMARGRYLLGHDLDDDEAIRTLAVVWARAIGLPTT
ncbi:MAG: TetR/AcrR family transcriptional regulator [Acidimicrobiales bacterium]